MFIGQTAATVTHATIRVAKNNINIGRQVELTTTEFTKADDNQFLCFTFCVSGYAVLIFKYFAVMIDRGLQANVCKRAQVSKDFIDRRKMVQITPDQAHHFPVPELAESRIQTVFSDIST